MRVEYAYECRGRTATVALRTSTLRKFELTLDRTTLPGAVLQYVD